MSNALSVGLDLLAALSAGAPVVIADMTGTRFCDSACVSELRLARQTAAANGTELRIVVTSALVRRVLAVTGLDAVLPVYASLDAPLATMLPDDEQVGDEPAGRNTAESGESAQTG
jgi:anti-sigma B factor antagonist